MLADLKELWRFRELLISMVQRELKIRYKNSFLGFFWSLLNPLITVFVMTIVFEYFIDNPTPSLSVYVLSAYLPYMFLQFSLLDASQSVIAALPVVRKVYFPREILPLAMILSNFIHFLLALCILFLYLLYVWIRHPGISPVAPTVALLPVLIAINLMLATGLGLIISALNTFYEDVKYIVNVVLYLMYFLCPIIYFSENIWYSTQLRGYAHSVYFIYHLNPFAMLSTSYKKLLIPQQDVYVKGHWVKALPLDWGLFAIMTVISVACLIGGYAVFNRMKWRFVERP